MASPVQGPYVGAKSTDNTVKRHLMFDTAHLGPVQQYQHMQKKCGKSALPELAALARPSCLKGLHTCCHKSCSPCRQGSTPATALGCCLTPSHEHPSHRHKQALPQGSRTTAVRDTVLKKQKFHLCAHRHNSYLKDIDADGGKRA